MFENLLEAEQKLLEACQKGEVLHLAAQRPSDKTDKNEIRGAFLRQLILRNNQKIDPKGIRFRGAYVSGEFDFSFCETHFPFIFINSTFEKEIYISDSKIRFLNLNGSSVHSIVAQGLICEGDIFLRQNFVANGIIDFISAQIGGSLDCSSGKFTNENGDALNCNSSKIQGSVFLSDDFDAKGKVDFGSAYIGSGFICSKGKFFNKSGDSLTCNKAIIKGSVFLNDTFESRGGVNFGSAQIGSGLYCSNGTFINENGDALSCNNAKIEGGVFLSDGFNAEGKVNFGSVQIGSSLSCSNGKFTNDNDDALSCDKAQIQGSVFLKNGFEAKGKVNFGSAQIGSSLDCTNGKFTNENGDALNCHSLKIQGSVLLHNAFDAKGKVSFAFAQIGNTLLLSELNIIGDCSLTSVKVDTIREIGKFWDKEGFGKLYLDGLVYNHLSGNFLDASSRKNWLDKMPDYEPQPYKQLAKVLRNMGHDRDADDIMIEYHDKVHLDFKKYIGKIDSIKSIIKIPINIAVFIIRFLYKITAGYGYKPMRVFITMALIWIVCGTFYWATSKAAVFAPSNPLIFQKKEFYECHVSTNGTPISSMFNWNDYNSTNNWTANTKLDGEYSTFSPYWYSLDILLPIVDLQMDKDWGQFVPSDGVTLNHVTRWVVWFEILAGWIFSLILVAILSGLAKNEKD